MEAFSVIIQRLLDRHAIDILISYIVYILLGRLIMNISVDNE